MSLASEILAISGLKGYWKLDDGTGTGVDDSGPGNHDGATSTTAIRTAAGLGNQPGKATQFGYAPGGVESTFTVAHHADFNVVSAFSLVRCYRMWGQEFATSALQGTISGGGTGGLYFGNSVSGTDIRIKVAELGGPTICTSTSGIGDIDRWHLVVITWDGSTLKIYLDGTDVSGTTTAPSPALIDGTDSLAFGNGFARETMAHIALYNKELSPGERSSITAAFNAEKTGANLPSLKIGIHQDLVYNATAGVRQNAITRLRAVHATLSRNTIIWENIEPTEGNFDWTRHDDVMNELEARDMEMHAVLAGSPTWANGGADRWQVPGTGVDASFNTWLSLCTGFATTFATRYLGRIHRYELWNEPNLLGFWSNGADAVDPAQYRAWYNAVRSAILAVDATAEISTAGLTSWSAVGAGNQTGETFFRNCMAAGSMTIDHFAYHPYVGSGDSDPDTFLSANDNTFYGDIRSVRDVLLEFGHDCPIWLTEFGWASAGGSNTETTQRDRMQHGLEGIRDRLRDIAEVAIIFIDYDQSPYTNGLYSDMPGDGSAPTAKLSAAMYSTFAQDFDLQSRSFRRHFGPALLTDSAADLLVVPAGFRARIVSTRASNPSGASVDLTLSIGTDATAARIYDGYPVAADGILDDRTPYDVAAGEKVQGFASSADALNLTLAGWIEPI